MSDELQLQIKLLSDTTFGRGDGVAGLVDQEVEHDDCGFPYLRGRTLKGLLSEECDNLIVLLKDDIQKHWLDVRNKLFGVPGSVLETMSIMHVGDACLPDKLRQVVAIQIEIEQKKEQANKYQLTLTDILNSLTTIRRQTAINSESGSSDKGSLRSARVLIRDRPNTQARFTANLFFDQELTKDMKSLLVVGVLALRHLGSGRNRGRGHVQCSLYDAQKNNLTQDTDLLNRFGTITGDK
ncbi:RAMP superfamily CRISPR-associated protein [Dolichospermum sp. LEGE 00246]|uniref:RAMP superfamily CRISPR-associated protein n=1 Tax=Dolichospermum sp. LEGE 00246 TaxID=1828605 RepID=UPI00188164E8|nr:RAMP superfamily CRISPR-associated protein [Dolichospermum sp. LEGE 00246]MBE9256842.1 RAMP superfamily protein [Dolichospermum sp. LEGE 00246]